MAGNLHLRQPRPNHRKSINSLVLMLHLFKATQPFPFPSFPQPPDGKIEH